ncbi:hypothetical protein FRC02_006329 [Tulasnella sp. 418]|nr:hypothetical protein FRC02_006329 [Tulasnella sp. 418]
MTQVKNRVCLIVHDGWGISPEKQGNAIAAGSTTNMDAIGEKHSHTSLAAHGLAVGLSDGLMGNSEVGHLNIGAGRVVWQDIVKIDVSIKKRQFHAQENVVKACENARNGNGRLHLLGLVSDGGVHSHNTHLYALLETAKERGVREVYIHFFGDGRDTAPRSSLQYAKELIQFIERSDNYGSIATVVGRYYAMDRDKRWDRVKIAVDALVGGEGEAVDGHDALLKKIEERYQQDETDEFLKPIVVGGDRGRIQDNDTLFFFNYRSDRMRELTTLLGLPDKPILVKVPQNLDITTMSRYNAEFPFKVAFPPQGMSNVLAEWLSKHDIKQAHIAETEKYAHVTFFFNGGVEKQFPNEVRHMIPSPKVPTYDKQPEMSVQGVADKVVEVLESGEFDFVMCNFAPPDMVGHTGIFDAAVQAIGATDNAVGTIYEACQKEGYILLITADHGNAEQMVNPNTGAPHTAHTTNPVPFIMTGDPKNYSFSTDKEAGAQEGEDVPALSDVAPTVLDLMGLPIPEEMTGKSLLKK